MADAGLAGLVLVGVVVAAITQLVFVTIGMAHAVPGLRDHPDCDRMIYIWLIVTGAFAWGSWVLSAIFRVQDPNDPEKTRPGLVPQLGQVFLFCWAIYGFTMIFDDNRFGEFKECDANAATAFRVVCLFSLSFYAIGAFLVALLCCLSVAGPGGRPDLVEEEV